MRAANFILFCSKWFGALVAWKFKLFAELSVLNFFFAVFNTFQFSFSRAEETSKQFFQLVWRLST
jgi:hypothetical protein